MTKLNDSQLDLLERVRREAERVADLDDAAKEAFDTAKYLNREQLRVLAVEAAQLKLPIRQFGIAANTSDFNTIKALYPAKESA